MMFYKPKVDTSRPLLVALHSWSNNYRQKESVIYAEWCIANDWIFIHPNFRGPNNKPEATGSELVVGDVLSAIDYAKASLEILFRRQSGNARITVFDGAHDKNTEAAFRWLNQQRKR
jgi:hypothetical protein